MIVVTGAAGFIGSNLLLGLNAEGRDDLIAVDELTDGVKCLNLADARIADYQDKDEFLAALLADELPPIDAIFHQGACSATTEWNGKYMMDVNYKYSKVLLNYCRQRGIPLIYASSASVYGNGAAGFKESAECERPLNVYAYSKLLFDQLVRRAGSGSNSGSQLVGLRYFNVYGPREGHKGGMASTAFHFNQQIEKDDECRLFEGCDGYAAGEQRRDFIHVDDVVAVNLWFWKHSQISGIFNCGTGRSQPFNDVAKAVIGWHQRGSVRYVPFPEKLIGRYQSFTEANLDALRSAGYTNDFLDVADGVRRYMDWLHRG